ncbi:pectinesterase inhibitor 10-like [Euphorbia lathyris]|uniref:pectinesterase inhibitor 10-like n=1 Tax=Euphorbia lathyris TaxID=212925 RepID=UPI003313A8DC
MQTHLQRRRFLLSLLFTISLFHLRPTPAAASPSRTLQISDADFIRQNCNTTLYADICYSSLSRYARDIRQSPERLVRVSISVCHSLAKPLSAYISDLFHRGGSDDPRLAEALDQCVETFDMAIGEMEDSLEQMRNMQLPSDIVNVQTWMSSALTNAETCTEGLEEVSDGPEKLDVINRSTEVMDFTSIVLAFVAEISPTPPSKETGLTFD